MTNSSKYIVVRCPNSSRAWAILDTRTQEVVDGGFSTRHAAQVYIWLEYEPPQDR